MPTSRATAAIVGKGPGVEGVPLGALVAVPLAGELAAEHVRLGGQGLDIVARELALEPAPEGPVGGVLVDAAARQLRLRLVGDRDRADCPTGSRNRSRDRGVGLGRPVQARKVLRHVRLRPGVPGSRDLRRAASAAFASPRNAAGTAANAVVAAFDVDAADLEGLGQPAYRLLHPGHRFRRARAGGQGVVRAREIQREGKVGELEADALFHGRRELRVLPEPGGEIVGVVALPIDAAIGTDGDAGHDADAALIGVAAELLRRLDAAVAVAEEAVDDDGRDAVPAAEVDQSPVVGKEAARRLGIGVEDADFLQADLGEFPVGGVVPGPERAVGEAGRCFDRLAAELDSVGPRAAPLDQFLDGVEDARHPTAGNPNHRPPTRLGDDAEGALGKSRIKGQ